LRNLAHAEYLPIFETPSLQINDREVEVREINCATLLHRLNFGARSTKEYTINLYKGCTHNCSYCYAPSLIHDERQWGSYVDVKINAPHVLEKEIKKMEKDVVFVSSASDPYQPIEARYKITRQCLKVLQLYDFPVLALTRSPLVLRDLDILRKFQWIRVGFSISSLSDHFFEPGVPELEARLKALQKLNEEKIETWVSLAPIVPGIKSLTNFMWLFERLKEAKISAISIGMLRFVGYEASRKMFEERTEIQSTEALENGVEVIAEITGLAQKAGLDISCASLEWKETNREAAAQKRDDSALEQFI
jgi:DNA repair photolyase